MAESWSRRIVEIYLGSIATRAPGLTWRFMYGSIGYELWVDGQGRRNAGLELLAARRTGLAGLSVREAERIIENSLQTHFNLVANQVLLSLRRRMTLLELSNSQIIEALAESLEAQLSEFNRRKLFLVPSWRITPAVTHIGDQVVIATASSLEGDGWDGVVQAFGDIEREHFPPVLEMPRRTRLGSDDGWLGVVAGSIPEGTSRLTQLLGAVSICLPWDVSRLFSGAIYPTGMAILEEDNGMVRLTPSGPNVPPLLYAAVLSPEATSLIVRLMTVDNNMQRRIGAALEYIAAGWPLQGRQSFLHYAIALDALFGTRNNTTASIVAGVSQWASDIPNIEGRIRMLLNMRHELLHGRQTSVEACGDYIGYFTEFESDPYVDQIGILRDCLTHMAESLT